MRLPWVVRSHKADKSMLEQAILYGSILGMAEERGDNELLRIAGEEGVEAVIALTEERERANERLAADSAGRN